MFLEKALAKAENRESRCQRAVMVCMFIPLLVHFNSDIARILRAFIHGDIDEGCDADEGDDCSQRDQNDRKGIHDGDRRYREDEVDDRRVMGKNESGFFVGRVNECPEDKRWIYGDICLV